MPKGYIPCRDRLCGADDCPNCHPENFRGGRYVDDDDAEETPTVDPDEDKEEWGASDDE
jgi:hypothetical protein